jgi:translation initiation factor 2B subunit (eIF-2B alpha/beta/delta family)
VEAIDRAMEQLAARRAEPGDVEATLARAREALEALAQATAEMQVSLPETLQEHFRPSARHLAEVRGLMNNVVRRLERLEGDLLAERHSRVDDLQLLVDLIAAQWRSTNERLDELAAPRLREVA